MPGALFLVAVLAAQSPASGDNAGFGGKDLTSPYERAVKGQQDKVKAVPLVAARERAKRAEDWAAAVKKEGLSDEKQDEAKEAALIAKRIVDELERHAETAMLGCAANKDPKWAQRYREGERTVKMTPGGPVRVKPTGRRPFDLMGCERDRFVDEERVKKTTRLINIERILEVTRFEYGQGAKERALQDERDALIAELRHVLKKPMNSWKPVERIELTPLEPTPNGLRSETRPAP